MSECGCALLAFPRVPVPIVVCGFYLVCRRNPFPSGAGVVVCVVSPEVRRRRNGLQHRGQRSDRECDQQPGPAALSHRLVVLSRLARGTRPFTRFRRAAAGRRARGPVLPVFALPVLVLGR